MPRVELKGMSFEKGLRIFRKKCDNAGVKEECRDRKYYIKPNVKRNQANNYRKRTRELEARKAFQLERRLRITKRNRPQRKSTSKYN